MRQKMEWMCGWGEGGVTLGNGERRVVFILECDR